MFYVASNGIKTVVIERDPDPMNPRDPDYQSNITNMVCWHDRYKLGDKHDHEDPDSFAESMAAKYLSFEDLAKAIQDGKIANLHLEVAKDSEQNDYYRVMCNEAFGRQPARWSNTEMSLSKDLQPLDGIDMEDLFPYCSASELLNLCNESGKVVVMPLSLYDHSGISMSTSSFLGRAPHAEWDSGTVGFIYMDKSTAMENLALESEYLTISKMIPKELQEPLTYRKAPHVGFDDVLKNDGFAPVIGSHYIKNLYDPQLSENNKKPLIDEGSLKLGYIFKKDRTLYTLSFASPSMFNMKPLAHFNPDLLPLTEETWKARAENVLKNDVKEYDNYLTGEVYGYRCFEGLDEIDSCWGFNPGSEDIESLMKAEHSSWFGPGLNFETDWSSDSFDIDNYFAGQDFPSFREKIAEDVKSHITSEAEAPTVYPFAVSAEDLLANKDRLLDEIVEDLYEQHVEPGADLIHETIAEHAGVSRAVLPKLTVADLDPDRDYTAAEVMEIINKKPSLNDMIAGANAKREAQAHGSVSKEQAPER